MRVNGGSKLVPKLVYNILAWKPSAAKITKCYYRRFPVFRRFYRETKFLLLKSTLPKLEFQN